MGLRFWPHGLVLGLGAGIQALELGFRLNRSPKGNMWSAIPIVLLCMIVNWSERKQGSGPQGDEVL